MIEYIKKIQSKPEEERKKILYLLMAVSMTFVVGVWLLGLGFMIKNNTEAKEKPKEKKQEVQPFSVLKSLFSDAYKNIVPNIKIDKIKDDLKQKEEVRSDTVENGQINVIQPEN